MYRSLVFSAVVFALLASRANAIEMFTNFNNGTNVGFPPMEVPVRIYRGIGHGGWNPHAEGMYFRSNPPVPAMMPTGQLPRPTIYTSERIRSDFSTADNASDVQYVADRRRSGRSQRMPSATTSNNSGMPMTPNVSTSSSPAIQGSVGPTPAKAIEADDTVSAAPAKKAQRSVTVLRAQSGKSPNNAAPTVGTNEEFVPQSSSALFPNSAN